MSILMHLLGWSSAAISLLGAGYAVLAAILVSRFMRASAPRRAGSPP